MTDDQPARPATFKGCLELDAFKYTSATAEPTRRSPRRAASIAIQTRAQHERQTSSPRPPGSPPRKRKKWEADADAEEEDKNENSDKNEKRKRSRARQATGYAPPSTYAHLPLLPDAIAHNLLVLFVGLNPGIRTAMTGHAYNHPSNLFWKLMYSSGVTPRRCRAEEDRDMPALYSLGLTNIVARPTRNGSELSRAEMDDGVALLEDKARTYRPESVCVVGKSIWESIWRVRHGSNVGKRFRYGWQDETENMGVVEGSWGGARVFVASSTSGLAATLGPAEKESIWRELGAWVTRRRAERGAADVKTERELEAAE
ncbi:uracil DNA glycosylase superfamily protein [Metarhizium album ARSEF 1941]|uniref:Uracil DNA glycosylase superfamily protein n=1 Tax=Metarhizium album (strain ARSEF 1941) TaxID=1081103 RepID=A0A0B2WL51_METAS|nr:uracil DNA glycosylase superfamily protein [Metarhizium album ARSEF 1941]KHN96761.1 uracil DNA glycosylase superfamily protein [Metarhizium album ARSEF 1941]